MCCTVIFKLKTSSHIMFLMFLRIALMMVHMQTKKVCRVSSLYLLISLSLMSQI